MNKELKELLNSPYLYVEYDKYEDLVKMRSSNMRLLTIPDIQSQVSFSKYRSILRGYVKKYNIWKYSGPIKMIVTADSRLCFYYNEILLKEVGLKEGFVSKTSHYFDLYLISIFNSNFNQKDEIDQLSYQYKIKNLLNELLEFHRYLSLDGESTAEWIKENCYAIK